MRSPDERDPMAAEIPDDVIEQAVRSVERIGRRDTDEPAPDEAEITIQTPMPAMPEEAADPFAGDPGAQLADARDSLHRHQAELEASQVLVQETLRQLDDQRERMLRAAADLENYKKRAARERDEATRACQERMLRELLPVLDNLERAVDHAAASPDLPGLLAGVQATRRLFESGLAKLGVKGFASLGEPFDPNRHEAMQTEESDAPPGTVVRELLRGYLLQDRLMRPAMVVVSRPRTFAETATVTDLPAVDGPGPEGPPDGEAAEPAPRGGGNRED